LEVLLFPVLNENIISSFVTCTGLENLDNALANGKGAMLLFAHFGANQMVMPAIGYRGYKMCQLSAPATVWKEVLPERRFTNMERRALKTRWEHECSLPVKHINIFGSIKEAFLCLKRNEILGVAVDGGGGKKNVTVNFLGRKALFSIGPIDIARRTGCIILPTFIVREESGRNTMMIHPPLEMDQGSDIHETITKTMRLFLQRLEDYVLAYPGYYMNFLALRSMMAEKGDTPLFPAEEE
ncbi:MAG: lysophospholipid acyltransferase family protein, partial [Desulfobacteraceae bacterium]|nr:lysophospholipid acyltransferase family protein [Desulfobacteraceae bacterium]